MQKTPRIVFIGSRSIFVPLEAALRGRYAVVACASFAEVATRLAGGDCEAILVEAAFVPASADRFRNELGAIGIEVPVVLLTNDDERRSGDRAAALDECDRISLRGRSWEHIVGLVESSITIQSLHHENALLHTIMECALDCTIVVDRTGRIVMANNAVVLTFGYLKHELLGRHLRTLFPPEDSHEADQEMLEACKRGTEWWGEATARRKDGSGLLVRVALSFTHDSKGGPASGVLIARDVTDLQRQLGRLEHLSIVDDLTHIYNVRYFWSRLRYEFLRSKRYQQHLSCLMADLDHFKAVNDLYGHRVGDKVLQHVAEVMQKTTREVDILARYGGEEFALILPNTDLGGALVCAENVRRKVEESRLCADGADIHVTVSIGVAALEEGIEDEEVLLRRADTALIRAKREGRNKVCAWQFPEMITMGQP